MSVSALLTDLFCFMDCYRNVGCEHILKYSLKYCVDDHTVLQMNEW